MTDAVYLDHNATAPLRSEAAAAMTHAMESVGNPSSVHGFGRAARKIVEDARERIAGLAGVSAANVIFTSGGSEANNMALRGIAASQRLTSSIEHVSVIGAIDAERVAVDDLGLLDLEALRRSLEVAESGVLVSVMAANNETGVVQPIVEIADLIHAHGGRLHVDAIQAAGKIDISKIVAVADAVSLSAHKMGGPQGVGALIIRDGVPVEPVIRGGGQERRRRAGTENVIGIAGFGAAAEAAGRSLADFESLAELRDRVERELSADATVYGLGAPRLANTTCLRMVTVSAEIQVMAFDLAGIAVSAGSACSSGKVEPSHVLTAMGVPESEAAEAIRVSFGWSSTAKDADAFIAAWRELRERTASVAA